MYRSLISWLLLFLLVGWVIYINPQARQEATDLWEEAKPTVVAWRDKVVEVFEDLINGRNDARIDHEPASPELNLDVIVTFNNQSSSF